MEDKDILDVNIKELYCSLLKLRIKFAEEQEEKYLLEKIGPVYLDGAKSYKKELYWNKVKTYWENKLKGL